MRKVTGLLVIVFVVTLASTAAAGALTPRLELMNATTWIDTDEAVALEFTLENNSDQSLAVLGFQTPFFGIDQNFLIVERDGQEVAYTGKLIKRATPVADDYIEIPAGDSLTVVFDPSAAYDMAQSGEYTVRYRTALIDVKAGSSAKSAPVVSSFEMVESNQVVFWMEGLPEELLAMQASRSTFAKGVDCNRKPCHQKCPPNPDLCGGGGGEDPPASSVEFVNCTSQQQNKALTAVDIATTISAASSSDLADGSSSLYQRWFGTYSSRYYNKVDGNFAAIADAFATKTVTINCTDANLGYYAYVYPGSPYEIYVCYYFFRAPNQGRDSASGTLVHEMSHFNVVAGTADYVYGEANALRLASTNPRRATNNADNYEYFAEDH